ncbi:TetR/AcrR family transcriptional regulator [Glycomyces sp. A-F 0318]|uniref:TetR/AcrR family transcriptional regulator n=1 Tax=Glycomyces amatae TaxID=2881355 RepID=UPI001E6064CD|nr:TetR/AcrR family transcriptional regulator [Glycomyces amatae]
MTASADNRRADARRSRAAILDAALDVLDADPDAGLGTVAKAAGVTRQTVYAHFATRERLLWAVADRITEETLAAMDEAEPDAGAAADALIRVLDAAAAPARRHRALTRLIGALPVEPDADRERHAPIADRLASVVERGQRSGEFDTRLRADWLAAAAVRLAHLAAETQEAGQTPAAVQQALRMSLLKLLAPAAP